MHIEYRIYAHHRHRFQSLFDCNQIRRFHKIMRKSSETSNRWWMSIDNDDDEIYTHAFEAISA